MKDKYCVICNERLQGFGNNAQPVKFGRCCDKCDCLVVIPARMGDSQMAVDLGHSLWQMRLELAKELVERTKVD